MGSDWPSIVDALRFLHDKHKPVASQPRAASRIGFALSSRDRFVFTLRALKALDAEGGFDVVRNDGSERQEFPELSRYFVFRNARLVESSRVSLCS
jgi:hypothetical protein